MRVALIRGKFLNAYEMQLFEKLPRKYKITAFASLTPFHGKFSFPVIKLPSPMDLPDFSYKMPILNRLFIDAHYLFGLEEKLRGFDLVHSAENYYHYTQQALNAKKHGYVKKVVATVLENIPFNNEGIWGRRAFKKRARQELDHIISLTQKTKDALILEGCEPSKITVIGHAIDTDRFTPVPIRKTKRLVILFVGRLEEEKGVLDIVEAAKLLHNDNLKFIMIGTGSKKNLLPKFITQKVVSYKNMPREYQAADIFVAPSKPIKTWDEQYNTALLEAQASGLPIVTTKTGGIPENVGDAAILIPPGDINAIVHAIKSFVLNANLRAIYGKKARERALRIHDSRKIAKRMGDLYSYVMSKK
ncbi:MAG: hypothetical protein ACD_36C00010G0002 [uncultured bacterium]|uniref:Glycosyl transferase family 1 domain-containing protein n=1 Tax=Candidatus Gottesmanbacteria bacterium RIFCSPLOWO2_01_FULL_43_11b TaxID=1798392 RepID=A0A1F6AIX8_9BACT|nr:MAG: hypothetical protein ACD_36C00010G0002 [uncultured bacterium]OGG24596.1 MAG: hypothetical protein A3A79_05430 [Candidatus Gottesmanbacteria bacterium RIFCSPLOWO2_01_FULL_43_11b]